MLEIEKAAAQVNDGDLEGALATLLAAWRKRKLVAVADLIDDVNRRITARAEPLQWRGVHGAIDVWYRMTRKGQAESERGRALGLLFEPSNRDVTDMLFDAHGWRDDPRVAAALVAVARRADELGNWLPRKTKVWRQLFDRVVSISDGRSTAALGQVAMPVNAEYSWRTKFYESLVRYASAAAEKLAAQKLPEPTADERAAIDRLNAALAPGRAAARTAEDLLAEVYAHPDDDGPRLVYADFLQERRGEFIALQIAATQRPLTDEERQRESKLLRDHARGWLGAIEPRVSDRVAIGYERGFVASCGAWSVDGEDPLAAHPAWWTLRELQGVIGHPVMRSLRCLSGIRLDALEELFDGGPFLVEDLEIDSLPGDVDKELKRLEKHFSTTERLPRLRRFGFDRFNRDERLAPAKWRRLLASPVGQRLEVLRCFTGCDTVVAWLADTTAKLLPPSLQRIELDDDPINAAWHLHLTRSATGRFSSLTIRPNRNRPGRIKPIPMLLRLVEGLPKGALTELVLEVGFPCAPADRKRLRAAADRLQLQRCELPWK